MTALLRRGIQLEKTAYHTLVALRQSSKPAPSLKFCTPGAHCGGLSDSSAPAAQCFDPRVYYASPKMINLSHSEFRRALHPTVRFIGSKNSNPRPPGTLGAHSQIYAILIVHPFLRKMQSMSRFCSGAASFAPQGQADFGCGSRCFAFPVLLNLLHVPRGPLALVLRAPPVAKLSYSVLASVVSCASVRTSAGHGEIGGCRGWGGKDDCSTKGKASGREGKTIWTTALPTYGTRAKLLISARDNGDRRCLKNGGHCIRSRRDDEVRGWRGSEGGTQGGRRVIGEGKVARCFIIQARCSIIRLVFKSGRCPKKKDMSRECGNPSEARAWNGEVRGDVSYLVGLVLSVLHPIAALPTGADEPDAQEEHGVGWARAARLRHTGGEARESDSCCRSAKTVSYLVERRWEGRTSLRRPAVAATRVSGDAASAASPADPAPRVAYLLNPCRARARSVYGNEGGATDSAEARRARHGGQTGGLETRICADLVIYLVGEGKREGRTGMPRIYPRCDARDGSDERVEEQHHIQLPGVQHARDVREGGRRGAVVTTVLARIRGPPQMRTARRLRPCALLGWSARVADGSDIGIHRAACDLVAAPPAENPGPHLRYLHVLGAQLRRKRPCVVGEEQAEGCDGGDGRESRPTRRVDLRTNVVFSGAYTPTAAVRIVVSAGDGQAAKRVRAWPTEGEASMPVETLSRRRQRQARRAGLKDDGGKRASVRYATLRFLELDAPAERRCRCARVRLFAAAERVRGRELQEGVEMGERSGGERKPMRTSASLIAGLDVRFLPYSFANMGVSVLRLNPQARTLSFVYKVLSGRRGAPEPGMKK
ncbi:hypothetical protein DFH06DRAFT_1122731 [Mycena polygramma]|nr:hypothetical protein DFH06DRAFT_1122731 [Mycena polygramma]